MQHADFNQPPPSSLTFHASGTLKDTFLFALTSEAELQLVIQSMRCCDVAEGDVLVEQGHQGICTMHECGTWRLVALAIALVPALALVLTALTLAPRWCFLCGVFRPSQGGASRRANGCASRRRRIWRAVSPLPGAA